MKSPRQKPAATTRLRSFWDHFWTMLVPFLAPFWDHFGNFGTILGPSSDHFGTILGPFWDHFRPFNPIIADYPKGTHNVRGPQSYKTLRSRKDPRPVLSRFPTVLGRFLKFYIIFYSIMLYYVIFYYIILYYDPMGRTPARTSSGPF